MKDSKEIKNILSRIRKAWGKKNGVINQALLDRPDLEIKHFTNKNRYQRNKLKNLEGE